MTHVIGIKSQGEPFIIEHVVRQRMRDIKGQDYLELFKKIVIYVVMALIAILIVAIIYTMCVLMWDLTTNPDFIFTTKGEVLAFIGFFFLAVIALEVMDIMYLYTKTQVIHVEVVMLVALTSVARELIVFDYEHDDGIVIAGVAILIASLAVAYYFIKKSHHDYGVQEPGEKDSVP
jgi:uncharacterized membrane protein (DUF373 family)